MSDDDIRECADLLRQIDHHQREIEDLNSKVKLHQERIDAARGRIDSKRYPRPEGGK